MSKKDINAMSDWGPAEQCKRCGFTTWRTHKWRVFWNREDLEGLEDTPNEQPDPRHSNA